MKNLIEKLKASGVIVMGGRADVHHNIDARKYLAEEEMAVFPDEYFSLHSIFPKLHLIGLLPPMFPTWENNQ